MQSSYERGVRPPFLLLTEEARLHLPEEQRYREPMLNNVETLVGSTPEVTKARVKAKLAELRRKK